MKPKLHQLKTFKDINGSLTPLYFKNFQNFKVKRLFIINAKKGQKRGDHAHKICTQGFIVTNGKIEILIKKKRKYKFLLSRKESKFLIVPPIHWCKIRFLSKNGSVLVLCDKKFSSNEYIRNYNNFLKIIKKEK